MANTMLDNEIPYRGCDLNHNEDEKRGFGWDRCDLCGRGVRLSVCDCCGLAYCSACAVAPDEGGNDCPNVDCNLYPVK